MADALPTSLTLLERARRHDADAWGRLVHVYAPLVAAWCRHAGVSGADADDVGQEVFAAAAAGLDRFRGGAAGAFRAWLKTITRRKLADHRLRRQGAPEAQGGTDAQVHLQQLPEPELPDDGPSELTGLFLRALELVRGEFEPRTWEAFWRAAVEGQAPALVAEDLGVTPAAVRKAKSRVLLRLRQEVGDLIA